MSKTTFWIVMSAVLIMLGISGITPLCAEVNMTEGKWEITTQISMEGMPMQMPVTKVTQCITKQNVVPQSTEKNCKVLSHSISGNTVRWKVRCEEKEGTTEGEGEITYTGNSYKGYMMAKMTEKSGQTHTVKMNLSGKRIGECTEADRKQPDDIKAQIEKAKPVQQELDARLRRAQELARLTVPEDGPGVCLLSEPDCAGRPPRLNLMEGQWEMSEETTSTTKTKETAPSVAAKGKSKTQAAQKDVYSPADIQKSSRCLTEQEALSYAKEASCVNDKKKGGNRITWKNTCAYPDNTVEERGGITYNGDTYEGVRIKKMTTAGIESTLITKLSGRRTGDGNCIAVIPRREPTTMKQPPQPPADAEKGAIPNPVKSLKKIFGF
jgi:hypothetical protein